MPAMSPGYSTPWAAPGIRLKALKWLLQRHAPLSIRHDDLGLSRGGRKAGRNGGGLSLSPA